MTIWMWLGFIAFLGVLVALDVGFITRRPRRISAFEARASVALWALAAITCGVLVGVIYDNIEYLGLSGTLSPTLPGPAAALQFITAFFVEVFLSLENLAVMALLFSYFQVDPALRARLLFLLILTSLVLRAGLIFVGASVLGTWWAPWAFAAILTISAFRLLLLPDESTKLEDKWLVGFVRRVPASTRQPEQKLFTREGGRLVATPLLIAFLATAAADFSFALDSVPAVFSITQDTFIAFASNALAILTMRSLFFALPAAGRFRYMKPALATLCLGFAVKLVLTEYGDVHTIVTLCSALGIMAVAIALSLYKTKGELSEQPRPTALEDAVEVVAVTRKNLRKILILIAGTIILIIAVPVGFLPGPGGLVVAALGLGVLATEFVWARRLLTTLKTHGQIMQRGTDTIAERSPPWLIPIVLGVFTVGVYLLARHWPFPETIPARVVWLSSIGGYLAIGYWAYGSIRAYRKRRGAREGAAAPGHAPADTDYASSRTSASARAK